MYRKFNINEVDVSNYLLALRTVVLNSQVISLSLLRDLKDKFL